MAETDPGLVAGYIDRILRGERRLMRAIINPAMIVTWLAGLYLAWAGHWFSSGRAWRPA